jgi:outer membrane protein assembly factor BamB
VVDYSTNTVYFATDLDDAASGQNSLFALDAITGALKWSTNAGAVLNRPMLNGGRLYIARKSGSVMAYDPAGNGLGGGAPLWASSLTVASTGTSIIQNVVTFAARLLIVDTGGALHAVQDTGSAGIKLWGAAPEGGVQFTSAPAVLQLANGTYAALIGRDDGTVQQVDLGLAGPTMRGTVVVGEFPDIVCTPTIDLEPGVPSPQRLVVAAASGKATRLKLPLCNSAPFGPASGGERETP